MSGFRPICKRVCACLVAGVAAISIAANGRAADQDSELEVLRKENQELRQMLKAQQTLMESVNRKLEKLEENDAQQRKDLSQLQDNLKEAPAPSSEPGLNPSKISLSGEGGVAFFSSQREGAYPNSEFRIDEAKLFVEAPVFDQIYFYSEINMALREKSDLLLQLGEIYVDLEDVSRFWHMNHFMSLRLGRMDIPFGEEYLYRDAIDNPLITHSVSDLWGWDEGVELYGCLGKVSYVMAVQNGGIPDTRDFDGDKSIAARLSYDPARWLHLSLSGMRTGELDAQNDYLSAMWFGNAFFRAIGSGAATRFHANLVEGDVIVKIPHGRISAFGGYVRYGDNETGANNGRDLYYYSIEAIQDITRKFYAGARFSQIIAPKGYPLPGNASLDEYFFDPAAATDDLWRLSLGLGYRWSRNFVTKAEYSFEHGREPGGEKRDHMDLFGLQAAFKF